VGPNKKGYLTTPNTEEKRFPSLYTLEEGEKRKKKVFLNLYDDYAYCPN